MQFCRSMLRAAAPGHAQAHAEACRLLLNAFPGAQLLKNRRGLSPAECASGMSHFAHHPYCEAFIMPIMTTYKVNQFSLMTRYSSSYASSKQGWSRQGDQRHSVVADTLLYVLQPHTHLSFASSACGVMGYCCTCVPTHSYSLLHYNMRCSRLHMG